MYSQGNEEKWVLDHFVSQIGSFLDIGAYDGKCMSNTHELALRGWPGVCVEPSPSVIKALLNLYRGNAKVQVINTAITKDSGLMVLHDANGDLISTLDDAHRDVWAKQGVPYADVLIKTTTMQELLTHCGHEFTFINLDVEGMNWELFVELPLQNLTKCAAMCIEFDGKTPVKENMIKRAAEHGYKMTQQNGENIFFVR